MTAMATLAYPVTSITTSGPNIITAASSSIHILNPSDPTLSVTTSIEEPISKSPIRFLAVSKDGKSIVTQNDDKSLKVWDVSSSSGITLRSTRTVTKRGAHISFSPEGDILFADRVGDVYVYPLDPKPVDPSAPRPQLFALASDPTLNPDADFLLGHVSIISQHLVTPDEKHIITADRDEHIRVSRYPQAYVIDRYLFGSDGFVSALHIPLSQPDILLTGGGESFLNVWNWTTGDLLSQIEISQSILPHRRVKSDPRKAKRANRKKAEASVVKSVEAVPAAATEEPEEGSEEWYSAPEGWMLPSGQGICIRKIESVIIGSHTIILFFSLGEAAIHSVILPADSSTSMPSPEIKTLPLPYPLIAFSPLPEDPTHILLSLDTAWGKVTGNIKAFGEHGPGAGATGKGKGKGKEEITFTQEELETYNSSLRVVGISADGELTDVSDEMPHVNIIDSLKSAITSQTGPVSSIQALNLYEDLRLFPRWPGLEEDEDLAGPSDEKVVAPPGSTLPNLPTSTITGISSSSSLVTSQNGTASSDPTSGDIMAASGPRRLALGDKSEKEKSAPYTREELEKMGVRALGKLRAKGVDVGDLLKKRRKRMKGKGGEVGIVGDDGGDGEIEGVVDEDSSIVENGEEGAGNDV